MADEEKAPQRRQRQPEPAQSESAGGGGEGVGDMSAAEEALEKGYIGERPESEYDPEEYSLQSGPSSPPYPLGKE